VLRLESLEARATPSATSTSTSQDGSQVVIVTGTIVDESVATSGAAGNGGTATPPVTGQPTGGITAIAPQRLRLTNVTVFQDATGAWCISGHVDNAAPIATTVDVLSGPEGTVGNAIEVDWDGNFYLSIQLDWSTPGGQITIGATNHNDGTTSDTWTGTIG
jgi:hypothetical protein